MNTQGEELGQPVRQVVVGEGNTGQRIDNFLHLQLKGIPMSRIYRILRRGEVRVNKGRIRQDYRLRAGDVVRIPPLRYGSQPRTVRPDEHGLGQLRGSMLFEDRSLLVLNKPTGMAVHGGSGLRYGVIEALRALRPDAPFLELAHRLDRDTSGCLVIAKKRSALRRLHTLLREKEIEKVYLALLKGCWRGGARRIDVPLRKNLLRSGERMVRVEEQGKPALTVFEPLEATELATLVRVTPTTGRTHQIRVHAAHMGHPVAGDDKYGDAELNGRLRGLGLRRLFLHAFQLRFPHPDSGEILRLEAPLGEDLREVLPRIGLRRLKPGSG